MGDPYSIKCEAVCSHTEISNSTKHLQIVISLLISSDSFPLTTSRNAANILNFL